MVIWVPEDPPRLSVVKPVYRDEMPAFGDARILANAARGCETVLVLDTNVLGNIHQFAVGGGHREDLLRFGLDQLISVLHRPPQQEIVITAGLALQEVPPSMVYRLDRSFEWFLSAHLPGYGDHPLILPGRLSTPDTKNSFWDKSHDSQMALALSYSLLLLLQVVLVDASETSPIVHFQRFIDLALAETDILGAKELEAARWCLSPPIAHDKTYSDRRRAMTRNFAKRSKKRAKTVDDSKHIALNGAHDLWIIASATYMEARGLMGIPQEIWIATYDDKLADYCRMFRYFPAGSLTGLIAMSTKIPSDDDPGYWQQSAARLEELQRQCRLGRSGRTCTGEDNCLQTVRRCEALLESVWARG